MAVTADASKKEKRGEMIREAVNKADLDELDRMVGDARGPRQSLWMVNDLRNIAFEQYLNVTTQLLMAEPDPHKNDRLFYIVAQELCFRAMMKDSSKYASVLKMCPIKNLAEMQEELQHEIGGEELSFAKDRIIAKNVFLCIHESYGKLLETLAGFAAVSQDDVRWRSIRAETYLAKAFDGRYAALLPNDEERFIRHALTHRDFIKRKDGKFILEDMKGQKKVLSAKDLDKQLSHIAYRLVCVIQAFALPGAVQYELIRIEMKCNKPEP